MDNEKKNSFGHSTDQHTNRKHAFSRKDNVRRTDHAADARPVRFSDSKPVQGKSFAPQGDRPARASFGSKAPMQGEKPFAPRGGRPARASFGSKAPMQGEKPFAPRGDRPARAPGEKQAAGNGERRFGRPARPVGAPARSFGNQARPFARPVKPKSKHTGVQTDGMPARRIAYRVIRDVTENSSYAALALNNRLAGCTLGFDDRRLITRLVYDTLDNLIWLDHVLSQVMAKPDTDIRLVNILRLGACQLLLEDRIPDMAATDTSVELCKDPELGIEGLASVCNGILRNLIRKKDELRFPDPTEDPIKALSVKYSVPQPIVRSLIDSWGDELAEKIISYRKRDEHITIRPNLTRYDEEAFEQLLAKKVWKCEKGVMPHSWHVFGAVDISSDADYKAGNFSIQGESSMMVCQTVSPRRGMQILDMCAAPGGKTCMMAEMLNGTGRVQAWELHEKRKDLIAAQSQRLGLENVRPMTRDASVIREDIAYSMDAVLLDAPCSGLGVMYDKPDLKLRVTEESIAELILLQEKLLDAAATYVRPGGVLVYSTCSMLKGENQQQIEAFLQKHPEFTLDKLPETVPEQFRQYEDVGLQLFPHRDNVGGFYICRMRRKR